MGVEIETITPGDGGNVKKRNSLSYPHSFCFTIIQAFPIFSRLQGRHSRRRGSASWCTMSVSRETGVAAAANITEWS